MNAIQPTLYRTYQWFPKQKGDGPTEAELLQAINSYKRHEPQAQMIIINIAEGTPIRFALPPNVIIRESKKATPTYMYLQTAAQQLALFPTG